MKLEITNCNNIDGGEISIEKQRLNIKYALNGTGKSTIARAIELQLKGDGGIKELMPFKLQESGATNQQPQVAGLDDIKTVAIFNDGYISQFAFKQDEVLANSFEIFIKTADYDKQFAEIEKLITNIKNTFKASAEIDQVIADLSTLSESFGKSKSGYSEAGVIAKGIGKGNKVANIPSGLESYAQYLKSPLNVKWIKWQMEGNTYLSLSDNCPYCTSTTTDKKDVISKVSKEYDPKSIEHLNKIIAVLDSLKNYFTEETNTQLRTLASSVNGLSKEQITYLVGIKEQADSLRSRLFDLRGMTYFSMQDADKVPEHIAKQKIDLPYLTHLNSPSTKAFVDNLNAALDVVLAQIGKLQAEIGKQTALITKTINENKGDINAFLKSAGYKYYVDVQYANESYKMRLRHLDFSHPVERGNQHLSYGEKNAFSLVLFMFECLSKNPDMVILDDPISSFDRNKKYAVMDMLFRGRRSLRNRTVLMMTHDLEPIIDVIYTLHRNFQPSPVAAFMNVNAGKVSETPIAREDLSTFGRICDENIQSSKHDIVKLVYLRRYFEVQNNKGLPYELLSNLLHKRASPFKRENEKEVPMTAAEIADGTKEIKKKMASFDYPQLHKALSDDSDLVKAYTEAGNNYEKLQIFRVLKEGSPTTNDVIQKFINETFHIENEFIMQLNPRKYELVPSFIIDECNRMVAPSGS